MHVKQAVQQMVDESYELDKLHTYSKNSLLRL
jgi:hypothetical protein